MSTTIGALDFCSLSIRIGKVLNCIWIIFIKCRPSATCLKFTFGRKKGCIAPFANKSPVDKKIIVLATSSRLCVFVFNNMFFLSGEGIVWHDRLIVMHFYTSCTQNSLCMQPFGIRRCQAIPLVGWEFILWLEL